MRWQCVEDAVKQIADALAMLRADFKDRIDSELIEVERAGARPPIVHLVDGEQQRAIGLARDAGDLAIPGHEALAAVGDEHQEIRLGERALPPVEHQRVQRILAGAKHPSRINELEATPHPLRFVGNHVARGSGNGGDDGASASREPVEQGGFADIGSADEHDGGKTAGHGGWGGILGAVWPRPAVGGAH
jgi:hypothetical protein